MIDLIAQAAGDGIENTFLREGVLGALVLVLGIFAYRTHTRTITKLDASEARERTLNELVLTRTIPLLERNTALNEERSKIDARILAELDRRNGTEPAR